MPVAAARGRQSVWSCRATRGGHRQSLENAIFTCSRRDSYRGQCGGRRFADITTLHMRHDSCQLPSSFVRLTLLFSPSVLVRLSLGYVSLFTLVSHLTEQRIEASTMPRSNRCAGGVRTNTSNALHAPLASACFHRRRRSEMVVRESRTSASARASPRRSLLGAGAFSSSPSSTSSRTSDACAGV